MKDVRGEYLNERQKNFRQENKDLKKTNKEISESILRTENAVTEMVAFTKKIEKENFDLEKEIKDRIEISKDEFRYRNELRTELRQLRDEKDEFEIKLKGERRENGDLHASLIKQYEDLNKELTEIKSSLWKWLKSYWREGTQCY